MNVDTGEIRRWDALSDEEKASGKWVKLPAHDGDGHHAGARLRTMFDDMPVTYRGPAGPVWTGKRR